MQIHGFATTHWSVVLSAGRGDLWDSGRVASPASAWIEYGGKPLGSFQRAWWKVQVWNAAGTASAWSAPAEWTMAILSPNDRKAGWIASPDPALRAGPLPIFRKEFPVDRPLRRALVAVSGAGFYELRINGAKVGNHLLAPAWTNFRQTMFYEMYDVTSMLARGPNALGLLVGNGFYNVPGGRYVKYTASFGRPRVFAQLHLEFEDGTTADIGTDGSWRVHDGPITFACMYGGEDHDARLEPAGWARPGFDDSAWQRPAGIDPPGTMLAQFSPPVRAHERFTPVRVTEPRPGVYVYDLGQNFAGRPVLTASGPAGAQVRMTTGELLAPTGLVSQQSSGGPTYFTYTLAGAGRETWIPRFSYTGFRYVQVEGAAPAASAAQGKPAVHELAGEFLYLDAARASRFTCSNPLFNRIHALVDAAVRSNLYHVLSDCPHREKLGWLEQASLMGPSILYGWDLRTFLPKVARDTREAQTADGLVPDIAPEYVAFDGGFRDSPEWGSTAVLLPWLAWQWYGDRRPLADSYAAMKRYSEYLSSRLEGGLLVHGLGDWYDIGPGAPGYSKLTPFGVTATATYYDDLRILERAALLLGRETDARGFTRQAESLRAAFQKAFYKPAGPDYATGSQTSLAMPLVLGLAPDAARPALVERLVADVRKHGNHPTAGDIGHRYLLKALLDAGRSDVICDMASRTDAPSYGAQLAGGATALTEAWDANPASSQNHLMLGHIEEWFYAGLAGIRPDPDAPGLTRIVIRPEPVGDVKSVDAAWETFRGPVTVRWNIEGDTFRLDAAIPPGMTATVALPAAAGSTLKADGARLLRRERARAVYEIGSGSYRFEATGFRHGDRADAGVAHGPRLTRREPRGAQPALVPVIEKDRLKGPERR